MARRIFTPYSTVFFSSAIILGAGLVNSILLARILGATGRGEVAAAILWPTLLIYLAGCGLPQATLYYAAHQQFTTNETYTVAIYSAIILSAFGIVIGYPIISFALGAQNEAIVRLSQICLIVLPAGMLLEHNISIIRSKLLMTQYNILSLIIPIGSMVGSLFLYLAQMATVTNIVLLQIGLYFFCLSLSMYLLIRSRTITGLSINKNCVRSMWAYAVRVYVGTIFSAINLRLDQVLLASLVSAEQLGLYVVAVKLAGIPSILTTVVTTVAVPKVASLPTQDERLKTLTRIFRQYWWIDLAIKCIYACGIPLIVPLVYGVSFSNAIPCTLLLVLGSLFYDSSRLFGSGLQALNLPWAVSRTEIFTAPITAILLILLVPMFGINGAAAISVISYFASFALLIQVFRYHFSLGIQRLYGFRSTHIRTV